MNNKSVKRAYCRVFLDNFTKKKIDEDSTIWYYDEKSSKKCSIRSKFIHDFSFVIKFGGDIWGYEIGVHVMDGKNSSKYFDIDSIVILFNPIDYYKIKRVIRYMDYTRESDNKKKEVEFLIDKLPINYQRKLKIKSL